MPQPITASIPATQHVDADFAADVLADLYRYPHRKPWVAWLLWGTLGLVGGHRFYLDRPGSALLYMFTGGGFVFGWIIDAFLLHRMVSAFNSDQDERRVSGRPPRALDFMPPLSRDVLSEPPAWIAQWRNAGAARSSLRLGGDVLVLSITGMLLGAIAGPVGVYEAVVAIAVLAALTAMGGSVGRLDDVPVARELIRWNHRLRLFYYYNKPGRPLALLFRPVTAAISAPFRRRDRAEVRLYLQLGGILTALFLLIDLVEAAAASGLAAFTPLSLFGLWMREAIATFLVIYAFATPIGAVLTVHLLMRRTHVVPRALSAMVLVSMLVGILL